MLTGNVLALFRVDPASKELLREESLRLERDGILGDKHYGKLLARSILLTSTKSYDIVRRTLGVAMPEGYLGENILVSADIYDLAPGALLRIGDNVTVEITRNCTLCNHLAALHDDIPALLKEDRGIFAKTVTPGRVFVGDTVRLVG